MQIAARPEFPRCFLRKTLRNEKSNLYIYMYIYNSTSRLLLRTIEITVLSESTRGESWSFLHFFLRGAHVYTYKSNNTHISVFSYSIVKHIYVLFLHIIYYFCTEIHFENLYYKDFSKLLLYLYSSYRMDHLNFLFPRASIVVTIAKQFYLLLSKRSLLSFYDEKKVVPKSNKLEST